MMVVLVDKLVKTQIVECSAVANWIFSSELGSELTNFYIWEILSSTIEKMNRQVEKHHNELVDLRRQLNMSTAVQSVISSAVLADVPPPAEPLIPSTEEKTTDETKMDESDNTTNDEEKSKTNHLKRRRESDGEDDDDEDDQQRDSTEKIQSMQISQPPMDEATAKLHEKYEVVEERLLHAREQQK